MLITNDEYYRICEIQNLGIKSKDFGLKAINKNDIHFGHSHCLGNNNGQPSVGDEERGRSPSGSGAAAKNAW
jgi:hypothetical protein